MSVKFRRLLVIYTLAALTALGACVRAAGERLEAYRLATGYSAARAFEEAVTSADALSDALKKLAFTNDPALGKSLCAEASADAQSAETALSVLPFSTQELEKLQGFFNRTGDYAASLCALTDERLSDEHRGHLRTLGEAAAGLAGELRTMQTRLHDGSVRMDSLEKQAENVGTDGETPLLSALLLGCEKDFAAPEAFSYDGRFSPARAAEEGSLTEDEARELAAKAAGVEPRELREEYACEGTDGRRCYSAGGLLLGVSDRGLEFMAQSRLVSGGELGADEAREKAEAFLTRLGYEELILCAESGDGVTVFHFAPTQDGVVRPDDALSVSVARDDGSIYAFDATRYSDAPLELRWSTDEQTARGTLPEGVEAQSARRVIRKGPGGASRACWELFCTDADGERARVYVDADTGRQWMIEL